MAHGSGGRVPAQQAQALSSNSNTTTKEKTSIGKKCFLKNSQKVEENCNIILTSALNTFLQIGFYKHHQCKHLISECPQLRIEMGKYRYRCVSKKKLNYSCTQHFGVTKVLKWRSCAKGQGHGWAGMEWM
jgi:hypothetical protein